MALTTRQRSKVSRWIQIGVFVLAIVVVALAVDWKQIATSFFSFDKVAGMFPGIIVTGLKNTITYTAVAFLFGLTLGLVLALMRMASFAPYRWVATAYIEFFRGVPALLVLIAFGYGVPQAFPGVIFPSLVTVMLGLGMPAAAYIAETLRAGLQAVPKGQMEAARSLGMPQWRAMVTIVIPQAFRIVLPPLTNELILVTKDSSLVYIIGFSLSQFEMTQIGRSGLSEYGAGMTPLVVAGVLYLIVTIPLSLLARWFERRTSQVSRPKRRRADGAATATAGALSGPVPTGAPGTQGHNSSNDEGNKA